MNDRAERSRIPPGQQLVAPGKWPVVGERAPAPHEGTWELEVSGLMERPGRFTLDGLAAFGTREFTLDIHCVTRWSRLDVTFAGILLEDLLRQVGPRPEAAFVSFVSHSAKGHSSSLALTDAIRLGTILAWVVDGQPLASKHGGPLRNVVPGRYFYKSVKWLKAIRLLATDELGTWESGSGYHNHADPWLEERYIASSLDKRSAALLIESRDFAGRDLLGILCDGHALPELRARGALLRNAGFRRAILTGADFSGSNLSNAHFDGADLQRADFRDADVEGASFAGADLRGARFEGASLTACTFVDMQSGPARIDSSTTFDRSALEPLTAGQAEWLEQSGATFIQ